MNCKLLTVVDLSWCNQVTDAAIEALAKNCTALTDVNLFGCPQITDAGIEVLSKNCPWQTVRT